MIENVKLLKLKSMKNNGKNPAMTDSVMSESPLLGPTRKSVGCDEERFISPEESRLRVFGRGEANLSLFHLIIQMQREGAIRFTQLIAENDYRWLHISYVPGMLRNQVIDVNCCPASVKYDTS